MLIMFWFHCHIHVSMYIDKNWIFKVDQRFKAELSKRVQSIESMPLFRTLRLNLECGASSVSFRFHQLEVRFLNPLNVCFQVFFFFLVHQMCVDQVHVINFPKVEWKSIYQYIPSEYCQNSSNLFAQLDYYGYYYACFNLVFSSLLLFVVCVLFTEAFFFILDPIKLQLDLTWFIKSIPHLWDLILISSALIWPDIQYDTQS